MTVVYRLTFMHPALDPYDGGWPDELGVWSSRELAEEAARKDCEVHKPLRPMGGYEITEMTVDGGPA